MKTLLSFCILLSFSYFLNAQDFPGLQRYSLGDSGFQVNLPTNPDNVELSLSDDSSEVWTNEVEGGGFLFGVICVKFAEPIGYDAELNTELLESYLDYLKESFEIYEANGYEYGHTMQSTENAVGISDYWVDFDEYGWMIKGWVSNSFLAVLYVGGGLEDPSDEDANVFLNSVRFPSN